MSRSIETTNAIPALRLAVTGAPATGKTTFSEALSLVLGLPRTDPGAIRTSSDSPGYAMTVETCLRAFERRVHEESRLDRFVSDGSIFHEWACELAAVDNHRRDGRTRHPLRWARGASDRAFTRGFLEGLEGIVVRRARVAYDGFIHLRLDAKLEADEPLVAPKYRIGVDETLFSAIHQTGKPYVVLGAPFEDVERHIAVLCGIEPRMSPLDAFERARAAIAQRPRAGSSDLAEARLR